MNECVECVLMVGCVCVFGHQCVNECVQLISGSDVSFVYVVCVSYMCLAYKGKSVYIYIYMVWVVAHQKFLHHPSPNHPTLTANTQTALGLRSLLDSAFTGRPSILNSRRAEGEGGSFGFVEETIDTVRRARCSKCWSKCQRQETTKSCQSLLTFRRFVLCLFNFKFGLTLLKLYAVGG